ncbi:MAG: trehalose-6-phosphate synthase [Dehalococcoidia bacterium]
MNSGDPAYTSLRRLGRPGPLIVVSNRGPFEHYRDDSDALARRPTSGGVAVALSTILGRQDLTWVVGAVGEVDRELVRHGFRHFSFGHGHRLCFAATDSHSYDLFYRTFSNPILWFLQHSLWHLLDGRANLKEQIVQSWEEGYAPVNRAFADAVDEEIAATSGVPRVMLHDYHLYLAPLFIRQRHPEARLQHFNHIPWPGPDVWRSLPEEIVARICEGMLANDSVAFQTEESKQNFALTCLAFLPGVTVDLAEAALFYRGRSVAIFANPISVDVFDLRRKLVSPEVRAYREALAGDQDVKTIVCVDRLDPAKNVAGALKAFDLLLQRHREWEGKVRMLAFLVPTREAIPEYRTYRDEVFSLVDQINLRHGNGRWRPVTIFYEQNRTQALAGLSLYDVLIANSIADGMNLVVKEGPILNERDGVVILSTAVGAAQELGGSALPVEAEDIEGTAEALLRGLLMDAEERRQRARLLRQTIVRHDLNRWLEVQMAAFREPAATPFPTPAPLLGRPASREEPPALIAGGIP